MHILELHYSCPSPSDTTWCNSIVYPLVAYLHGVLSLHDATVSFTFFVTAVMSAYVQLTVAFYIFSHENILSKKGKKWMTVKRSTNGGLSSLRIFVLTIFWHTMVQHFPIHTPPQQWCNTRICNKCVCTLTWYCYLEQSIQSLKATVFFFFSFFITYDRLARNYKWHSKPVILSSMSPIANTESLHLCQSGQIVCVSPPGFWEEILRRLCPGSLWPHIPQGVRHPQAAHRH